MKKCTGCKEEKEINEFYKGYSRCKKCHSKLCIEWAKAHRNHVNGLDRQRYFDKHNRKCTVCGNIFVAQVKSSQCSLVCKIIANVVKDENGCWNWQRKKINNGYGTTRWEGKEKLTHRWSYLAFKGPLEKGKYVCHTCDNRLCCNPDHLFQGTAKENMQDCKRKGRVRNQFLK
jgi:HNH endonuclease